MGRLIRNHLSQLVIAAVLAALAGYCVIRTLSALTSSDGASSERIVVSSTLDSLTINYGDTPAESLITLRIKNHPSSFLVRGVSQGGQTLLLNEERQGDPVKLLVERALFESARVAGSKSATIPVLGLSTPKRVYLASETSDGSGLDGDLLGFVLVALVAGAGAFLLSREALRQSESEGEGSEISQKGADPWALGIARLAAPPLAVVGLRMGWLSSILEEELARQEKLSFRPVTEKSSHIKAVALLLQKGVSLDTKNSAGMAPLHIAAQGGHVEAIDLLLRSGATVDLKNSKGETPLMLAAESPAGSLGAVIRLINAGASVLALTPSGKTISELAAAEPVKGKPATARKATKDKAVGEFLKKCEEAQRALFKAIVGSDLDAIQIALASGARVNMPDAGGKLPLDVALSRGAVPAARKLVLSGAKVREPHLSVAKRLGNRDLIDVLVAALEKSKALAQAAERARKLDAG